MRSCMAPTAPGSTPVRYGNFAFCCAFFRDESKPLRKVLSGLGFLSCCSQMILASSPSIPMDSSPANPKSSHNALTASVRLAPSITSTRRPSRSWMPPRGSIRMPSVASFIASRKTPAASNFSSSFPAISSREWRISSMESP